MKIFPIPGLEFLPVAVMATMLCGCNTTIAVEASSTRNPVVAPAGSVLRVRLNEALITGRSRPGDRFSGVLDSALVSGSTEILPKGTKVEGHVMAARQGKGSNRALLAVRLDGFELNGTPHAVEANVVTRTSEALDSVAIEADSIIGFTLTGSLKN